MVRTRLATLLIALFLGVPLGLSLSHTHAQPATKPNAKQQQAIQKIQKVLAEPLLASKPFQTAMPLAKFVEALEQQLPADKKIALRLDKEAFGDQGAEVAATPIFLLPSPKKTHLFAALERIIGTSKIPIDYRIDATSVTLTTPKNAAFTIVYDIHKLIEQPNLPNITGTLAKTPAEPAQKRAQLVQDLLAGLVQVGGKPATPEHDSIEILNGTELVIRTTGSRHALIGDLLAAFHRLADLAVLVQARLYEVDDAFYTKLKNAKYVPLDELEKDFLAGKPAKDDLFKLLKNQQLVLSGPEVKLDNGAKGSLLSWHKAIFCLPSPQQMKNGDKSVQTVQEGVSFQGRIQVAADRRSVKVTLTENAAELQHIKKVDLTPAILGDILPPEEKAKLKKEKEVFAEIPVMQQTTQTRVLEIADGGSILYPVQYRTKAMAAKNRWWVLSVTTRIWIEEEETMIRLGTLDQIMPALVADVLKNPKLQAARELWGSPGDKRFALVNSDAWTWPAEFPANVAGFQLTKAAAKGKRLLGLRINNSQVTEDGNEASITLSLINAGGTANGAAAGACTLRYTAHRKDKGWTVQLIEAP